LKEFELKQENLKIMLQILAWPNPIELGGLLNPITLKILKANTQPFFLNLKNKITFTFPIKKNTL
jgi:hypothetical protein